MNLLQRLLARWWAVWAAARGIDTGVMTPLPPALVNPAIPAASLIDRADAAGVADAKAAMLDNWSFGGPDDPVSDRFDPGFVHVLRHEREAALAALRVNQRLAESRTDPIRRVRDEYDRNMDDARQMMARLALREARIGALTEPPRPGPEISEVDLPTVSPDDAPWEGESNPLGLVWRLLILAGLIAAELPVQFFVFRYYLTGVPGASGLSRTLALSMSAFMVLGPYVAGLLLRGRQATGAERRMGSAVIGLAAGWTLMAVIIGVICGRILEAGGANRASLHLTPVTTVVMFVVLLLVVGVMAFMIGLARRHPFQEAYVRQRIRRDRLDSLRRTIAERINPAFREPDDSGRPLSEPDERAVRESYAAAEDAYFAALTRTVGDPVFTAAVQQRRGVRPAPPPAAEPPEEEPPPAAPPPAGEVTGEPPPDGTPPEAAVPVSAPPSETVPVSAPPSAEDRPAEVV